MNPNIRLLKTIGSPFSRGSSELIQSDDETLGLYTLALKNKIGLLYLEALNKVGRLGKLQTEYDKSYYKYSETVVTATKISRVLSLASIEHVIFKFIRPYPSTPSDVDILFLCSVEEHKEVLKILFTNGYYKIGAAPHQVVTYDLRGGFENRDMSLRGGKKGGIYYIDLYDEIAASHVIYMDKEKIKRYMTKVKLYGDEVEALKPEAELAITIAHSVIPEQLFTLADYYTTLYCLAEADGRVLNNFITIVRENNLTLAAKASIKITALLHQAAHGFVPERLEQVLIKLGNRDLIYKRLLGNDFVIPHRYGISILIGAMLEKFQELKFTKSVVIQAIAILNPRFGKGVIKDLIERRRRETY